MPTGPEMPYVAPPGLVRFDSPADVVTRPAPALSADEQRRVDRPAVDIAADVRDVERQRAYDEGRWCGECMYGVVMDPPCCAQPAPSPAPDEAEVEREPDAVLVEGDWISPRREAHARDLLKAWADAASNAGCPPAFVARMHEHVRVHDRLARAALAARVPDDALHEFRCPACGATTRARMADATADDPAAAEQHHPLGAKGWRS